MNRFRLFAFLAPFLALSGGLLRASTTYDVATDFSIASNPNGVWTYGFEATVGGAFTAFPTGNGYHCCSSTILAWGDSGGSVAAEFYNPGPASANLFGQATAPVAPGVAGLYPGVGSEALAAYRFTAPTTDVYGFDYLFHNIDTVGASVDVHVLLNGVFFAGGSFSGNGSVGGSGSLALLAGDTLDFLVGDGGNGNANDTTSLALTITAGVPEPATLAMTGLGLIAALVARRKIGARR